MKVLHVIPSVASRDGGPSRAVVGMCHALAVRGVDASIATTDADGSSRLDVPCGEWRTHAGVRTIFFPRLASTSFKWSPALARWLTAEVARHDVVHMHAVFSHSTLAAGRACRRQDRPYLVRPLGALAGWSLDRHRSRKRVLLALGLRGVLANAAAMHYTSEGEQTEAEGQWPWLPPGRVVGLGIDDTLFEIDESARESEPMLLMLGRIDVKKGLDLAIAAAHRLATETGLGAWRMVIAGSGDPALEGQLRSLADRGPAAGRIQFVGWADDTARARLLARAAVSVHPSAQENFGLAAVESLGAGVPVIVSPAMDLARDIERSGSGWVAERTPEALAKCLAAVLRDGRARAERGRHGRVFAERFRWRHVAEALEGMYREIATHPRGLR